MLNLEISCRGQTTCLYRVVLPHTDLYLAEHDILKEQISERKKKVSAKERKSELKLLSRDRLVKNVFILEGTVGSCCDVHMPQTAWFTSSCQLCQ